MDLIGHFLLTFWARVFPVDLCNLPNVVTPRDLTTLPPAVFACRGDHCGGLCVSSSRGRRRLGLEGSQRLPPGCFR